MKSASTARVTNHAETPGGSRHDGLVSSPVSPRISVVVPSYRRYEELPRCLEGISRLTRPVDEVLVVAREDDVGTHVIAEAFGSRLPVRRLTATRPGLVHALQRGVEGATGDIIVFTDDDAIPRPDWLDRIESHLLADASLAGVGGRDRVIEGGKLLQGERHEVGMITWYGKLIGNHHLGAGPPRYVHTLKGVNMGFWADRIRQVNFDPRLTGLGAQVSNEVSLCAGLRRRGWRLLFDPSLIIDHYPGDRLDGDGRRLLSPEKTAEAAFNDALCMLEHLPAWNRLVFRVWSRVVGTARFPGWLQVVRLWRGEGRGVLARRRACREGRRAAERGFRKVDKASHDPASNPATLSGRSWSDHQSG